MNGVSGGLTMIEGKKSHLFTLFDPAIGQPGHYSLSATTRKRRNYQSDAHLSGNHSPPRTHGKRGEALLRQKSDGTDGQKQERDNIDKRS